MLLMALMAGATFTWGVFYIGIEDYKLYYKLDIIDTTFTLYLFPLTYFYFKSLTNRDWFGWAELLWLIPGAVIGILSTVLYLAMGDENAGEYMRESFENLEGLEVYTAPIYELHFFINIPLFHVVLAIQVIMVIVLVAIQMFYSKGYWRSFFTRKANEAMKKNRLVFIGLWLSLIVILSAFLVEYYWLVDFNDIAPPAMAITGILYFILSYCVYRQPDYNKEEVEES